MAKVQVTNVTVLDNPTAFLNPCQFEITFECLEDLPNGEPSACSVARTVPRVKWRQWFVFLTEW